MLTVGAALLFLWQADVQIRLVANKKVVKMCKIFIVLILNNVMNIVAVLLKYVDFEVRVFLTTYFLIS